jgi:hypothetical protein
MMVCGAGFIGMTPARVLAQTPATPPTTVPALPPSIDARFPHYSRPGECVTASRRLTYRYWRSRRADTVQYDPLTDSIPTPVRDSVRACAASFVVATVPVDQLIPLAQLELIVDADAQAQAAVDRLLASPDAQAPKQRAWLLELVVHAFADARPMRLAAAQRYLAQLDAMGGPATYTRLAAHLHLGQGAWTLGDVEAASTEAAKAIALYGQLDHSMQLNLIDTVEAAYQLRAQTLGILKGKAAALASLDSAGTTLRPIIRNGTVWAQITESRLNFFLNLWRQRYVALGDVAQGVGGDFWFGTADDTIFPKRGKVTLLVEFNDLGMYDTFAVIRRLQAKYGSRGLQIVGMASTHGFFRDQLEPKAADEANLLRDWYLNFMHVPVALAVEVNQFGRMPDGRRKNTPALNQRNYGHADVNGVLVDKDGTIDMAANVSPRKDEAVLDRRIAAALAR